MCVGDARAEGRGEPQEPGGDAGEHGSMPSGGLILPGGKVDPQALRRAWEESSDDDALGRVRLELSRELDTRLDKYLTSRIPFMSRSQLQRLIDSGAATVNGRTARSATRLHKGDVIEIDLPPPPAKEIQPEEIALDVLFEDEHVIVLNKQADIIVHPARSELRGTMINALAWRFQHVSGGGLSRVGTEFARPGVVHRLDRHTTGCIVFAKDDEAHWKLGAQFEHRTVAKHYLAVVQGRVEPDYDVIELPIGPHPSRLKGYREKFVVRHDELGKPSTTVVRVRERYWRPLRRCGTPVTPGAGPGEWYSLIELDLKTGRTHQIRVHMSHLGWPIVGDDMYGGRPYLHGRGEVIMGRQALHAATLAFDHPVLGGRLSFTAPLPRDMAALVADLRGSGVEAVNVPGAIRLDGLGL
ncbi:MAG: RluA family pseudouridine synthase [Phycisphaeraceae bacterium]|nr:RluA family pseudouridine synthase [Phycisphaeraceae bacterium]